MILYFAAAGKTYSNLKEKPCGDSQINVLLMPLKYDKKFFRLIIVLGENGKISSQTLTKNSTLSQNNDLKKIKAKRKVHLAVNYV